MGGTSGEEDRKDVLVSPFAGITGDRLQAAERGWGGGRGVRASERKYTAVGAEVAQTLRKFTNVGATSCSSKTSEGRGEGKRTRMLRESSCGYTAALVDLWKGRMSRKRNGMEAQEG